VAAGKAFDVAIAMVRRAEEEASDDLASRYSFDEAPVGGTVEIEAAVFHQSNIQTQFLKAKG
jgi:hypothetical protein